MLANARLRSRTHTRAFRLCVPALSSQAILHRDTSPTGFTPSPLPTFTPAHPCPPHTPQVVHTLLRTPPVLRARHHRCRGQQQHHLPPAVDQTLQQWLSLADNPREIVLRSGGACRQAFVFPPFTLPACHFQLLVAQGRRSQRAQRGAKVFVR
ncbi:hypothetical protein BD309DRAFT_405687 [Dichomitus squalens]|uniref:Uncharacterized protein n=1 Tax=Dichomitus squalens TaxID=114155 RepID=A0A4Q9PGE9_9APHY|nr:hypothetical protein BD309DRAFT_405687 [Dichomitus squalens]TBU52367.1 hypothetical protein BD310DRAFT_241276 [Dichomitus squalens]